MEIKKLLLFATVMVLGSRVLSAQQAPPTERKGQTIKTIASLDVGPH